MRALLFASLLFGCGSSVVRDTATYQAEVEWFQRATLEAAANLREQIQSTCLCVDGEFVTEGCSRAAFTVTVIESRAPWHSAMMLYNAGILEKRPPKDPPSVPPTSVLCPNE